MPLVALIVGTYALWITAKGELGKYLKLATVRNQSGPTSGSLQPVFQTPGGNSAAYTGQGATTTDAQGNQLYIPSLTP